ncbi:response regulator transcription factor [Vallitalea okinawensis]|uniref:response regulator transcription factor n=1 Tax=Vallitalea okinawensis TaxID=2078660 RepID=UPI001FA833A2|nr:response regulator [Vallitalea okinawensis]
MDDEPIVRRGIQTFIDFEALSIDKVYEASNGEEALQIFKRELPDLVLADINMPKMNGLEFAAKSKGIKENVKIAFITGYDYFDYAVAALKTGVDDYILKPVSKKDIYELLQNLITKIRNEKVDDEVKTVIKDLANSSGVKEDCGYQAKLHQLIEENISNSNLNLVFLADQMGLSVGYLSGLFKKLFNVSFKEYVLSNRMERAKILLLSTEMKNYEIAEIIGFQDPNYFSACFKKWYGESPGKYREKVKE